MDRGPNLDKLINQPTLDDIMFAMLVLNLTEGKVWANYQGFKDFFDDLRSNPLESSPSHITDIINRTYEREIDHSMTRVSGLSGLVSYICEVGNDYWYIDTDQADQAMRHFDRMGHRDQAALTEIARRYGEYLQKIGR